MHRRIEELKQKPEHVRHRIAVGASVGATALVAVAWLVAHAATGTFALNNSDSPDGRGSQPPAAQRSFSELLGAVGQTLGATSTEPELTVVDGRTTSTLDASPQGTQNQTSATAIPF